MSKYSKKLKDAAYKKHTKETNRKFAAKKKQSMSQFEIDNASTKTTFLEWLDKCGKDLGVYVYSKNNIVLSCCGSDGPTIKEYSIDGVPYNNPEAIDKWLEDNGLYESFESMTGYYNAPSIRYLDWFNNKYNK